jgi:hypothetical protein
VEAQSWSPSAPSPSPQNRMVEPKAEGHSDSSFGRRDKRLCLFQARDRSPKGAQRSRSSPTEPSWSSSEPSPAPRRAWPRGMTAIGHRHCALPCPSPSPQNRVVEPKNEGHNDFPFWAQQSALLPLPIREPESQGGRRGRALNQRATGIEVVRALPAPQNGLAGANDSGGAP